jgi:hypothetical protein
VWRDGDLIKEKQALQLGKLKELDAMIEQSKKNAEFVVKTGG